MKDTKGAEATSPASDNLSVSELFGNLTAKPDESTETTEGEEQEETEESDELPEETESDEPEETEEESEGISLDDLTDEQIQAIAKQARSRAASDFGKMRAEIAQLRNELAQKQETKADPLADEPSAEQNPFKGLATVEELRTKKKELTATLKFTESLLDDHEGYGPNDIIHSADGRDFTKKEIKQARNNAREAIDDHLPAQLKSIEDGVKRVQDIEAWNAKAATEIPELAKEDSPVAQAHKAWMASPLTQELLRKIPEGGWLLAHAARSLYGGKKVTIQPATTTGTRPAAKVPASPSGVGAPSTRPQGKEKAAQAAKEAFERSGSTSSLAALLAQV